MHLFVFATGGNGLITRTLTSLDGELLLCFLIPYPLHCGPYGDSNATQHQAGQQSGVPGELRKQRSGKSKRLGFLPGVRHSPAADGEPRRSA